MKDIVHTIGDDEELSFWFMRDNHTFARPIGSTLKEIANSFLSLAKENPYGMVCQVIVLVDGKEYRRIGKNVHVDGGGIVDVWDWAECFEKTEEGQKFLNLENRK